jgi:phosphate transport system ATP-binding protein
MSHISVIGLSISYGSNKAIQNLHVDIPDRQVTAIIGPSGCGKTTLLKSLNRLIDLNDDVRVDGQVLIDGINIYAPGVDVLPLRKKVGFMAQRPFPLPMSIYDNIAFGPRIHGMTAIEIIKQLKALAQNCLTDDSITEKLSDSDRITTRHAFDLLVETYLRLSGLWDEVKNRLRDPASQLSVGQQQRLALARTLSVEPSVILADEPTSALDPISAKLIEKQFQLLKRKYTIIVVTHILRQARRIADYIMFMYLGELVEHGSATDLFGSPRDPRTKSYVSGEIS